ncbi:MAG: hypothetical protein JWO30_3843 [Fibrobacteres bacterium]|nr:hypothetical protein [Fibrobacterota bacterium]
MYKLAPALPAGGAERASFREYFVSWDVAANGVASCGGTVVGAKTFIT